MKRNAKGKVSEQIISKVHVESNWEKRDDDAGKLLSVRRRNERHSLTQDGIGGRKSGSVYDNLENNKG